MTNPTPENKPTTGKLLYRADDLIELLGFGRAHLYNLMKRGEFPQPIKIGHRAVAWPAQAIDTWLAERMAAAEVQ